MPHHPAKSSARGQKSSESTDIYALPGFPSSLLERGELIYKSQLSHPGHGPKRTSTMATKRQSIYLLLQPAYGIVSDLITILSPEPGMFSIFLPTYRISHTI